MYIFFYVSRLLKCNFTTECPDANGTSSPEISLILICMLLKVCCCNGM